jgi:hypothetical protein
MLMMMQPPFPGTNVLNSGGRHNVGSRGTDIECSDQV